MNILLITTFFPPDAHVGANRWHRFSREFSEHGHRIHVIAWGGSRWLSAHDCGKGDINNCVASVTRVTYPFSTRVWILLARCSRFPYWALNRAFSKITKKSNLAESSRIARLFERVHHKLFSRIFFPARTWAWGQKVARRCEKQTVANNIDIIVATHPFIGTLRAASLLSEKLNIPWVADMRDPLHNDHQCKTKWECEKLRPIEQKLLKHATAVVTINGELAAMLETDKDVCIIPSGYDDFQGGLPKTPYNCESGVVRCVYTGTIQADCAYRIFFNAIIVAFPVREDSKVNMCIDYYGNDFARIACYQAPLARRGVQLRDNGFVNAPHCRQVQAQADFLLLFGWIGEGRHCVMTGKVFDYLAVGRPIIAVTERSGALFNLMEETGSGFIVQEVAEIGELIGQLVVDSRGVIDKYESGRRPDVLKRYEVSFCARKYMDLLGRIAQRRRNDAGK